MINVRRLLAQLKLQRALLLEQAQLLTTLREKLAKYEGRQS